MYIMSSRPLKKNSEFRKLILEYVGFLSLNEHIIKLDIIEYDSLELRFYKYFKINNY